MNKGRQFKDIDNLHDVVYDTTFELVSDFVHERISREYSNGDDEFNDILNSCDDAYYTYFREVHGMVMTSVLANIADINFNVEQDK